MVSTEQVKAMLEVLRDQGFVNADDEEEMEVLVELAHSLLTKN